MQTDAAENREHLKQDPVAQGRSLVMQDRIRKAKSAAEQDLLAEIDALHGDIEHRDKTIVEQSNRIEKLKKEHAAEIERTFQKMEAKVAARDYAIEVLKEVINDIAGV